MGFSFLFLERFQIFAEPVEVSLPLQPSLIDPMFGEAERLWLDTAGADAPDFHRAHETRVLQYRQVLHDGR